MADTLLQNKSSEIKYAVLDPDCMYRLCFHPGMHSGFPCCMQRQMRGCPVDLDPPRDADLAQQHIELVEKNWRLVRAVPNRQANQGQVSSRRP